MQSKRVGKFRSKQFGCKKRLDLLTVDVLNGFYCISDLALYQPTAICVTTTYLFCCFDPIQSCCSSSERRNAIFNS